MGQTTTYNCDALECTVEDTRSVLFTQAGIGLRFVDDEGTTIAKVGEGLLCEEHRDALEKNLALFFGPNFLQERESN